MKKQSNKWKALALELKTSILEYWNFESEKRNKIKQDRVVNALEGIRNLENEGA
jgi:hypothetical protein